MTTEISVAETGLSADRDLPGTTYQWVDCDNSNTEIDDATDQSFSPSVSGNYACVITTGACESISACVTFNVLATEDFDINAFALYPNPTTGQLYMSNTAINIKNIAIYNSLGMLVGKDLNISGQAAGIYFVKIDTEEGSIIRKIVKQ